MPLSLGALPRTQNVVGYWLLDEASGTRVDKTPNGNDLTDNNTVTQGTGHEGGSDKCAYFTRANNEYLSRAAASCVGLDGMSNLTISFWFNAVTVDYSRTFVTKGTTENPNSYTVFFYGFTPNTRIKFEINGNNVVSVYNTFLPSQNTWYHVACVFKSADSLKIYINGELDNSQATTETAIVTTSSLPFIIGNMANLGNAYGNGSIDEVAIWNCALNATEVKQIYTETCGGAAMLLML